ncbi:hypothetical protein [Brevibacterium aurantiacum]|uniref:hypothetical protein n=1 Tax=Brevibacterium aurantiacum TaxID=273384 RepID=UPI003F8EBB00
MKYVPNRKGLRELSSSQAVGAACATAAERGADWARRLPVEGPERLLSQYRAGFRVEPSKVQVGGETRAGALLINDSDVERIFGARNHVLWRAVAQIEGLVIR